MRMKMVSVVCVLLIVLTGCGGVKEGKVPGTAAKGFTCTADIQFDGKNVKVKVVRNGPDVCSFEVLEPQSLQGFKIAMGSEGTEVSYHGVKLDYTPDSLPKTSFASAINEVLNALTRNSDMKVKPGKDIISVTGRTASGDFTVDFDADTMHMKTIHYKNGKLVAQIEEIAYQ